MRHFFPLSYSQIQIKRLPTQSKMLQWVQSGGRHLSLVTFNAHVTFVVKVCKIALVLRDEPLIQWDNRLSRRGATWLKHKPGMISVTSTGYMCVFVCVCWRWQISRGGGCFEWLTRYPLCCPLWVIVCSPGIILEGLLHTITQLVI